MIFTRPKESQTPTRTLPEAQIHFFQQDLLRQSAARQHVFPNTAGDAVHRHLTEVEDIRLVRVLVRAGEDPDPVYDPVAEALYEAVNAGVDHGEGSSEGREQAEMAWRQQREHQRREDLADGLASWFEDLRELGVPKPWLLKVMEGLVERLEGLHSGDEENEMEGLEFLRAQNVHNEEEDRRDLGDQVLDAVDNVARAVQSASRQVKGFARRGVEALVAQFAGKEREDEEWELVENPDRRGRRRRREGDGR
ncbi:hypothetical protein QBC32DRAFT_261866 [Pseudoneurospora amorphoporcata]|uniref:Uncharacterized protein n=1 Tax=Pseudoneurospora amorphoporcata TaxID=241081 RepID=A0AAN6NT92_9PEZI|nr:hypothetical protein QBC32DRAFT_261866 [Pseudoneurospora amorphoporcata]